MSLSVANERASLPIAYQLYLPEVWAGDPERHAKGHRQLRARLVACRREGGYWLGMRPPTKLPYAGYRFPPEVISHTIWLYFRFPLSLTFPRRIGPGRG